MSFLINGFILLCRGKNLPEVIAHFVEQTGELDEFLGSEALYDLLFQAIHGFPASGSHIKAGVRQFDAVCSLIFRILGSPDQPLALQYLQGCCHGGG